MIIALFCIYDAEQIITEQGRGFACPFESLFSIDRLLSTDLRSGLDSAYIEGID
jgi:hypothetical protein